MLARMGEPPVLLIVVFLLPSQFPARSADGEGRIQKDQDVGLGDLLPHGLHVGVFLRDVAAGIAILFEPCDQRGFARTTGTYDTDKRSTPQRGSVDKRSLTWRLHNIFVVTN